MDKVPVVVSEAPPPFRGHGRTAKLVAIITTLGAFLAAVIVPPTVAYINRPPPPKANTEEVLKALKEESERKDKEIRQLREDILELRGWLKGYLKATGVRVRDPEDPRPPPSDPVEMVHGSGQKRRSAIERPPEVLTPLPSPKTFSRPKEIPEPVVPIPQ